MKVTIRAGAKVTLSLRVTGVRADGYHELDAVAVCCDAPYDELVIDPTDDIFTVVPCGAAPQDSSNLAIRALQLLGVEAGMHLHKAIPSRAGLGGGSSDAAAVLRHFAQGRTDAEIRALAATLGADVPVCYGQRAARMRGIGEILDFIELPGPVWLMIATPSFGCSTPEVYRAYDELAPPARVGREIEAPPHWDGIVTSLRNDLELAAWAVEPRLAEFREKVECAIVRDAFLCGSGSSYAAWFNNQAEAEACAAAVGAAIPDLRLLVSTRCQ